MFKRKQKLSLRRQVRELIWPSMGFRRAFRYVRIRIVRMSDSSHKITLGLAIGIWIAFSPLVGTHFIQAGILAYFLRGNILAALIGTLVGTPWTFPLMWWASIELGVFLTSWLGIADRSTLPDDFSLSVLWDFAMSYPLRLFVPWMIGGYVLGLVAAFLSYAPLYRIIHTARTARARAKMQRVAQLAREIADTP